MALVDNLQKNIRGWGIVAVIIVLMSVVLLKFKTSNIGGMTCSTQTAFKYFNSTANYCCTGTSFTTPTTCVGAGNQTAIGSVAQSLDTFVAALSEPKNWVVIFIIALIGFAVLKMFTKKKN